VVCLHSACPGKRQRVIAVVTACMRRDGSPTFVLKTVQVTEDEALEGIHYLLVEEALREEGYDEPFVHFDEKEAPPFLHPAVCEYLESLPKPEEADATHHRSDCVAQG
jgi:hypothetical protein